MTERKNGEKRKKEKENVVYKMWPRLCIRLVCIRANVLVHASVLRDFSGTHLNLHTV